MEANASAAPKGKDKFAELSVEQLTAAAQYVEHLLDGERLWITNRLSWLVTSQAFLLAAFVAVAAAKEKLCSLGHYVFRVLHWGVPIIGWIACVFVAMAVIAADRETEALSVARVMLTESINSRCGLKIPRIGISQGKRDRRWTLILGGLPHLWLPWVLASFWMALLLALCLR